MRGRGGADAGPRRRGLSAREIERRMEARGMAAESISGLFLTHEHHDHCRGALVFASRWDCPSTPPPARRRAIGLEGDLFPPSCASARPRDADRTSSSAPSRPRTTPASRSPTPSARETREWSSPRPRLRAGRPRRAPARGHDADGRDQPRPRHAARRAVHVAPEAAGGRPPRPPVEPGVRGREAQAATGCAGSSLPPLPHQQHARAGRAVLARTLERCGWNVPFEIADQIRGLEAFDA